VKVEEAMFPLILDAGAATVRLAELSNYVICTMPEPWTLVELHAGPPLQLIEAGNVELEHLREIAATVPEAAEAVVGFGGGSSLDTAKFISEANNLPLIQIPSIISVDAAFTPNYGYRDGRRVRYAGHLRPVEVIVDPRLARRAPPALNRAGGAAIAVFLICAIALDSLLHGLRDKIGGNLGRWMAWIGGLFLVLIIALSNYGLVFIEYREAYRSFAWNSAEMGQVVADYAGSFGSLDSAWVVAYPHWVDTRLVAINAGFPGHDYGIWPDQLVNTLSEPAPKLFLVKP